jgi:hypothetical protein
MFRRPLLPRTATLAALLSIVGLCGRAVAQITTTFVPVPISPAAIAADPTLANYQTWDLRVNIPQGQHWGFSGFEANLTAGQFYNHEFGGRTPQPQLWSAFPQLRYDTFVTQAANPNDDSTFIAPTITSGFPNPPLQVVFIDQRISIVYHAQPGPGVAGPGAFTIARLTFRDDSVGTIVGDSVARPTGLVVPFAFTIPVPEPAGAACVLSAAWALCARRHRSAQRRAS